MHKQAFGVVISGLILLSSSMMGCATATGPTELLEQMEVDDARCRPGARCAELGLDASQEGRFDEAMAYFHRGCQLGEVVACRRLGDAYALGQPGDSDLRRAAALYRWNCEQRDDGASCHSLGELYRLQAWPGSLPADEGANFRRACELGELTGCHDGAVLLLLGDDVDDEVEEAAAEIFEETCRRGLAPGCTNLAYMMAAGRGTARDHGQARQILEEQCRLDDAWVSHPLASIPTAESEDESDGEELDKEVYAVTEYSPEAACAHLEVLAVGSFEERVIAAVDAERDELRRCYDRARPEGEDQVGRLIFEASVSIDGAGNEPRIVEDTLGFDEVRQCAQRAMSRHLDDGGDDGPYRSRWGISFIHPPQTPPPATAADQSEDGDDDNYQGCRPEDVQEAVGGVVEGVRRCGREHLDLNSDDPGAVMVRWNFTPSGRVNQISTIATVVDPGLIDCLDIALRTMEIPAFDGGLCPVQAPFVFSRGDELHFSIISR